MNNSININDFNLICRICLESKNDMISCTTPEIIQMLESCTSIQETSNNNLPQQMCTDCYEKLKNAFNFKQQYLLSIQILTNIIQQSANCKEEKNVEEIEIKKENDTNIEGINNYEVLNETIKEETENVNTSNSDAKTKPVASDKFDSDYEAGYEKGESTDDSSTNEIKHKTDGQITCKKRVRVPAGKASWNTEIMCDLCGKKIRKKNMRQHQEEHSDNRPYESDICHSTFKQIFTLAKHKEVVHKGIPVRRKELCFICGKICPSLFHHLPIHEQIDKSNPFKCDICDKVYLRKKSLRNHFRLKHKNGIKTDTCKICNKQLVGLGSMKKHMLFVHSNAKREHVCTICNKDYKTKSQLNSHIRRVHKNERPHTCTVCERSFHTKDILRNHMRRHTGERPFSCNICGKSFSFKHVLGDHLKTHARKKETSARNPDLTSK